MAKKNNIPEVDIIVDEKAGVIREVQPDKKLRSKKGHEMRVNASIYIILILMSIIWLCPFVFLVLQSFRSYLTEHGGMVSYIVPKAFSMDNYIFLFQGVAVSLKLLVKDTGAIILTVLSNLAGIAAIIACLIRKPKNPLEKTKGNFKAAALILLGLIALNFVRCVDSSNCDFVRWFLNTLTIAAFCA